jgi:hypothetical protein
VALSNTSNWRFWHRSGGKDVLNGSAFQTAVPFPLDPAATATTSPFMPFGVGPVVPGAVVPPPNTR